MKPLTCVVIGGGYAGIHAVKTLRKTFKHKAGLRPVRLVLIDRLGNKRRRTPELDDHAVDGAGLSGIETAAELAHFVRGAAQQLGLDPGDATWTD